MSVRVSRTFKEVEQALDSASLFETEQEARHFLVNVHVREQVSFARPLNCYLFMCIHTYIRTYIRV